MKKWGTTKSMNNSGSFTWKPRPQGNQDTVCARPRLSTDSIISYSLCGNWCSLSEEKETWWSMGIFATCVQQTPFLKAKAIGTSFKAAVQQFFCSMTDAYSSSNSWLEHPSKLRVVLLDPSLQMMLLIDLANLSCKQGRQEHPLLSDSWSWLDFHHHWQNNCTWANFEHSFISMDCKLLAPSAAALLTTQDEWWRR